MKTCLECGNKFALEMMGCPECGSIESLSGEASDNRSPLLKVSSGVLAQYNELCKRMNLNPEPGINFESDDDVMLNIEALQQELLRTGESEKLPYSN